MSVGAMQHVHFIQPMSADVYGDYAMLHDVTNEMPKTSMHSIVKVIATKKENCAQN